jgi:hypothetical protein
MPEPTARPTAAPTPAPTPEPTPTPPETRKRAHLAKVELRNSSGELAPLCPNSTAYSCLDPFSSIWVYVTSPGVPTRTILVETPSEYLLAPRRSRTREDQIPSDEAVTVHTAQLDGHRIIMEGGATQSRRVLQFGVRMSETSAAWGTYEETTTISCDTECFTGWERLEESRR